VADESPPVRLTTRNQFTPSTLSATPSALVELMNVGGIKSSSSGVLALAE
jgi:hypothetical protein